MTRLACVVIVAVGCACARHAAPGNLASPADSLSYGPAWEVEDSLVRIVEDASEDAGSDVLETMTDAAGEGLSSTASLSKLDVVLVSGSRSGLRWRLRVGDWGRAGMSWDGSGAVGFGELKSAGPLRRIAVGRMHLQAGERLVLGRGFGSWSPLEWGSVRDGVRVVPTLSRSAGVRGVLVEVGQRSLVARAVLVDGEDDAFLANPASGWLTLSHAVGGLRTGIVLGGVTRSGVPVGPGVVSATVAVDGARVRAAGELAAFPGHDAFAALRAWMASVPAAELVLFRAPWFSSSARPDFEVQPPRGVWHGAELGMHWRSGRLRFEARGLAAARRSHRAWRQVRRLRVTVRGSARARPGMRWSHTVDVRDEHEVDYTSRRLTTLPDAKSTLKARYQAALDLDAGRLLWHRLRVDLLARDSAKTGFVLSAGTRTAFAGVEFEFRASAFDLPPGTLGYITRPGVAYLEYFAPVSGGGSDVSARICWRFASGGQFFAYLGAPVGRPTRVYLGLSLSIGNPFSPAAAFDKTAPD